MSWRTLLRYRWTALYLAGLSALFTALCVLGDAR